MVFPSLNGPGHDYISGEFVLTQQIPRAQSKAIVLEDRRREKISQTYETRLFKRDTSHRGYYEHASDLVPLLYLTSGEALHSSNFKRNIMMLI